MLSEANFCLPSSSNLKVYFFCIKATLRAFSDLIKPKMTKLKAEITDLDLSVIQLFKESLGAAYSHIMGMMAWCGSCNFTFDFFFFLIC